MQATRTAWSRETVPGGAAGSATHQPRTGVQPQLQPQRRLQWVRPAAAAAEGGAFVVEFPAAGVQQAATAPAAAATTAAPTSPSSATAIPNGTGKATAAGRGGGGPMAQGARHVATALPYVKRRPNQLVRHGPRPYARAGEARLPASGAATGPRVTSQASRAVAVAAAGPASTSGTGPPTSTVTHCTATSTGGGSGAAGAQQAGAPVKVGRREGGHMVLIMTDLRHSSGMLAAVRPVVPVVHPHLPSVLFCAPLGTRLLHCHCRADC